MEVAVRKKDWKALRREGGGNTAASTHFGWPSDRRSDKNYDRRAKMWRSYQKRYG